MSRLFFARLWVCGMSLVFVSSTGFAQEKRVVRDGSVPAVCVFKKNAAGHFVPSGAERVYQAHQKSAMLRVYDVNCNGIPEDVEVAAALNDPDRDLKLRKVGPALVIADVGNRDDALARAQTSAAALTKGATAPAAKSSASDTPPEKPATDCPVGLTGYPIVRDSYADLTVVKITDCPPALGNAKGAMFSYTRDDVAPNTQWAAQGVIAERFLWYTKDPCAGPCVSEVAFAPIARFQRLTNSNAKLTSKNLDVLSPGLSGELLIDDPLHTPLQLYLRGRVNANGNFEGIVNSWSQTLEVQPVYGPLYIGERLKIGSVFLNVSPVLRAQYFERTGKDTDPIFATANHVFRVGPGVAVLMRPLDRDPVPAWLQKISLSATYDWLYDEISHRTVEYSKTTLGYDITTNFGMALSYEKGKVEETGKDVATTMLALTVKY